MNYIDLGLPSGTLWAETNEKGFYTFDEAQEKYGAKVPSVEQWKELLKCFKRWDDERKGLEILGENGNKLFLPAAGYRFGTDVNDVGSYGYYWSSTPNDENDAYNVYFDSDDLNPQGYGNRDDGLSVRLVR